MDTPDSVMQVTEDEMMEIDKLVILTPGNQLPDLFRKQVRLPNDVTWCCDDVPRCCDDVTWCCDDVISVLFVTLI